jgi:hypothetical protein
MLQERSFHTTNLLSRKIAALLSKPPENLRPFENCRCSAKEDWQAKRVPEGAGLPLWNPLLSRFVRDILAIPTSSPPAKSIFFNEKIADLQSGKLLNSNFTCQLLF